jgi:hypothetical protein
MLLLLLEVERRRRREREGEGERGEALYREREKWSERVSSGRWWW